MAPTSMVFLSLQFINQLKNNIHVIENNKLILISRIDLFTNDEHVMVEKIQSELT